MPGPPPPGDLGGEGGGGAPHQTPLRGSRWREPDLACCSGAFCFPKEAREAELAAEDPAKGPSGAPHGDTFGELFAPVSFRLSSPSLLP
ncbi:hypothetical protein Efla_006579 [Eimeria flavescens]